jgi:hypothetical protein
MLVFGVSVHPCVRIPIVCLVLGACAPQIHPRAVGPLVNAQRPPSKQEIPDAGDGYLLVREGIRLARAEKEDAAASGEALLARGARLLERELGVKAHAGVRSPPVCGGHFSNALAVRWLSDDLHVEVSCADTNSIIDSTSGERVANLSDTWEVDAAQLPSLHFRRRVDAPSEPSSEDEITCPGTEAPQARIAGDRVTLRGHGPDHVLSLRQLFSSEAKTAWSPQSEARWSLECLKGTSFVAIRGDNADVAVSTENRIVVVYDTATRALSAPVLGSFARALDDGRLVFRHDRRVSLLSMAGKPSIERVALIGADVASDGKRWVYVEEKRVDSTYLDRQPFLKSPGESRPLALGDFRRQVGKGPTPAAVSWPRIGPLPATSCAKTGTMPSTTRDCSHPGITVAGRRYDSAEEIACNQAPERAEASGEPLFVCLDPRGPVAVPNPWSDELVCRIGPYVFPLGACPSLLARSPQGSEYTR